MSDEIKKIPDGGGSRDSSADPSQEDLFSAAPDHAVKPLFGTAPKDEPSAAPKPLFAEETAHIPAGRSMSVSTERSGGEPETESPAALPPEESSYLPVKDATPPEEPVTVEIKTPDAGKKRMDFGIAPSYEKEETSVTAAPPDANRTTFREVGTEDDETPEPTRAEPTRTVSAGGTVRKTAKNTLRIAPENSTLGGLMRHARNQAGMELSEVAEKTRIKTDYIDAIEQDNYSALPAGIFPSAYVRRLCAVYRMDDAGRDAILEKLRTAVKKHDDVPETLIQTLESEVQKNEVEDRRARRIFYGLTFAGTVLLLLAVSGILFLVFRTGKKPVETRPPAANGQTILSTPFDSSKLETLTPPRIPGMRELNVPKD